jgi:hypothetical protein
MLAVGIDTRGNPVNLYTGEDFVAAQAALDAAGQAGIADIVTRINSRPASRSAPAL